MSPYIITILFMSLGLGTTLTFMSSHWLMAWMGLEINTLAILPLMAKHHHPRSVEATTKYFLTQATAAATILFASTINTWVTGEWDITHLNHPISATMVMMALALKVGLAPLHFWMPSVMQGLDLMTALIMATWQKLAPFALMLQMSNSMNPVMLTILGMTSTIIGGWGGMNQTQLRKTMAYSSIAHLGWMIIILQIKPELTMLALVMYIIMTSATFLSFSMMTTTNIKALATNWSKNPIIPTLMTIAVLSLGGLPPLTGFMPKWLILQELTMQGLPMTATIMALSALLSLYFYLRLCYTMMLTTSPNTNNATITWRLQSKQHTMPLAITMMITLTLLPLTPMIQTMLS
uniref:NADH-ubiquinone oxidoreductase chain 2 n=1 Tax=Helogenes marmoratus TaxID=337700 RepID=F7UJK7_9TELE|nr:NADH dehydrogenase subunit 2 [Helogenes marmoratus]